MSLIPILVAMSLLWLSLLSAICALCLGESPLDASVVREQADRALQSGNSEQAVRLLTTLIQLEPNRQINHYKRSVAHLLAHKYDLAETDANKAIELDNTFIKAYLHRGKLRRRTGDCHGANLDFNKLIELGSNSKDIPELIRSTQRCIELQPLVEQLYNNKNWEHLRHALQELTQIVTNSKKYLEMEIEALALQKDFDMLIATAGKLLLFDKNNMLAYLERGNAYYLTGNQDMAIK